MSNTSIVIKRSSTTGKPASLAGGEVAYSYLSNTLFIGTVGGTNVYNIGGVFYTSTIDSATSANTPNTLVKRDGTGAFVENPISGLSAGSYGGSSAIPVFTVAANGKITSITTTAISAGSTFNVNANTGGSQVVAAGNTLTLQSASGSGLTTTSSANSGGATVVFGVDTTILRSNTTGNQTISSDLTMTGNVTILQSNIQSFNIQSTTVLTGDSLIQLASNNIVGDLVDIGFYGTSNIGSIAYHGLIREGSGGPAAGQFFLFKNLATNPTGNVISYAGATRANLVANLVNGTVANLASAIGIADGGTNNNTYTASQHIIYDGSKFTSLANSSYTATGSPVSGNTVTSFSVDGYNRVTAVTFAPITLSAAQITSGLTASQMMIFNGTSIISLANSGYTQTGTATTNNTVTSFTTDVYGRTSAATFAAIAGLTVGQGGTGAATFAQSGIMYGNGTSPLGVTAIAGGSDQTFTNQILTVNASNVPIWSSVLDGGQF